MNFKRIVCGMMRDTIEPYASWGNVIPIVVFSDHPRFVVGNRFDYGFLQVALEEGYNVALLQPDAAAEQMKELGHSLALPGPTTKDTEG